MDRKAIAEDVVGLWDMIGDAWLKKHEGTCKTEAHISLFERAHAFIIHTEIGKQQDARYAKKEASYDEQPSDKQIKYARDLGCENPETMSRKQISEWIENNK